MKKCFRSILCFVITAAMICPFVYASAKNSSGYTDVSQDFWAYKYINSCTQSNWLNGYPDGSFLPEGDVTRAEAIKTLAVYLQRDIKNTGTDEWYTPYVNAAKDILPKEWEGENLLPDTAITREELAYLLVSALGYDVVAEYPGLDDFSDKAEISETYVPYVASAVKNGLLSGHDNGTIGAKENLTRAELATLLCRAEDLKKVRENIENIVEIRVPVDENGIAYSASGQYFVTEIDAPTEGYYKMDVGYITDNWVGYLNINAHTPDGEIIKFLQCLQHGDTQRTFLMYLKAGKNTIYYYYHTKDTKITHLKCLGREEEFTYEITPKTDLLFLDNQKQPKTVITNYTDTLVKVETADGINIPFEATKLSTAALLRPKNDIFLDKEAVYNLGEGVHTLLYHLESGKVLEQEIKIRKTTPETKLQYIHFNVDKANATLFRLPNGKYLLVDSATNAMAEDKVVPYLEKNNIKLDYYLITHFHKDHVGLKDEIIKSHNLPVPDADKVTELLKADKETRYNYLKNFSYLDSTMLCHYDDLDKIWDLGGVDIEILNSRFDENGDKMQVYKYSFIKNNDHNYENATSVSFMLDYNGFRYYHGADNYAFSQERYMADMIKANRTEELNCHWFFANHHFIVDYSPLFINTLNPVAVYVPNIASGLSGLYEKYYKQAVENYYFSHKRLENTLISSETGSARVCVNSADDWYYENILDEDLFK